MTNGSLISACVSENQKIARLYPTVVSKYDAGQLQKFEQHSNDEAFSIAYHLGNGSGWLNGDLRNGMTLDSPCKVQFAHNLDQALEKLDSFSGIVYRMDDPGDTEHELRWFAGEVGKIFTVKHYLSTSKDSWDHIPMVWSIKTLTLDSFGKDISRLNKFENEVLFKRNVKFRIERVDLDKNQISLSEVSTTTIADFDLVRNYSKRVFSSGE